MIWRNVQKSTQKQFFYYVKNSQRTRKTLELIKQGVRAAGSVGANYIEANDSVGKKDFAFRIKICRKEAKESGYWLRLISSINRGLEEDISPLIQESTELMNIFGAILKKTA